MVQIRYGTINFKVSVCIVNQGKMCIRDRQKATETDAQPQAEVRHQIPEETDTPMEGKPQDAPVYPEAEYDLSLIHIYAGVL